MTVVEFADSISAISNLYKIQEVTLEAMRTGIDVINRGTLFDGRWLGRTDIMRRVPLASNPDAFANEIEYTKFARRGKGSAFLTGARLFRPTRSAARAGVEEAHLVFGDMSRRPFSL